MLFTFCNSLFTLWLEKNLNLGKEIVVFTISIESDDGEAETD